MYGKLTPGCLALYTLGVDAGKVVLCRKFIGKLDAAVLDMYGKYAFVKSKSSQVWEIDTHVRWCDRARAEYTYLNYAFAEHLIPLSGDGVQLDSTITDVPTKA